ncbi:MAG: NAD(P)H-dependent glycerol-3-phosphate dehydrogenase, partial [Planktomarina sp.]
MTICVLGAGAFGTALAVAISETNDVTLWGRNPEKMAEIQRLRTCDRLPGIQIPHNITATANLKDALGKATFVLSAIPLQSTANAMEQVVPLMKGQPLIGCSKGMDLKRGTGGFSTLNDSYVQGPVGVLTGPSFAIDIAKGLPTALTLATDAVNNVETWQDQLSTNSLRLYGSDDPIGAELGGALKNVIAIACGAAMGAGLGESARAALMTRGNAEVMRFALSRGARPETLAGLSG